MSEVERLRGKLVACRVALEKLDAFLLVQGSKDARVEASRDARVSSQVRAVIQLFGAATRLVGGDLVGDVRRERERIAARVEELHAEIQRALS